MGKRDMNNFYADDTWQRKIRDKTLAPYYSHISKDGRFVFLDKGKLATKLQREFAIDSILQGKGNSAVGIEEKIVRWPGYKYTSYTLETMSCTIPGREKQGWMYYSTCDYLLYCFLQADSISMIAHLIPFQKLQNWFFEGDRYKSYRSSFTNQINRTETKIVPIDDVWGIIPECKELNIKGVDDGQ